MTIGNIKGAVASGFLASSIRPGNNLSVNIRKLASGQRITKASDDSASLEIATSIDSDLRATRQAIKNVSDGISVLNTAEGGLNQINSLLTRARELSVQASNGTLSDSARSALNSEFSSIKSEITRISEATEFNGRNLLDGSTSSLSSNQINVQAGIAGGPENQINLNVIDDVSSEAIGIANAEIATPGSARDAIGSINSAISKLSSVRANVGALLNRFDTAAGNLGISAENLVSTVSSLTDLDIASETSSLSQNLTIQKAGISIMKKVNKLDSDIRGSLVDIKV